MGANHSPVAILVSSNAAVRAESLPTLGILYDKVVIPLADGVLTTHEDFGTWGDDLDVNAFDGDCLGAAIAITNSFREGPSPLCAKMPSEWFSPPDHLRPIAQLQAILQSGPLALEKRVDQLGFHYALSEFFSELGLGEKGAWNKLTERSLPLAIEVLACFFANVALKANPGATLLFDIDIESRFLDGLKGQLVQFMEHELQSSAVEDFDWPTIVIDDPTKLAEFLDMVSQSEYRYEFRRHLLDAADQLLPVWKTGTVTEKKEAVLGQLATLDAAWRNFEQELKRLESQRVIRFRKTTFGPLFGIIDRLRISKAEPEAQIPFFGKFKCTIEGVKAWQNFELIKRGIGHTVESTWMHHLVSVRYSVATLRGISLKAKIAEVIED